MSKRKIDLSDPNCEPTKEEFEEILLSVHQGVQKETEMLAKLKKQLKEHPGKADNQNDQSFDIEK